MFCFLCGLSYLAFKRRRTCMMPIYLCNLSYPKDASSSGGGGLEVPFKILAQPLECSSYLLYLV